MEMDLNLVCRICLDKNALTWINLTERFNSEFTIEELINYCCGIELSKNISLPKFICKNCELSLLTSYKIKKTCLETEKMLLEQLETNIKKENELEIIDTLLDPDDIAEAETPKLFIRNDLIPNMIQEESFVCEICLYKSSNKLEFRKHVVDHTMNQISRKIQPQPSSFSAVPDNSKMGQHSNTNQQYQCNYCAQLFVSQILLENHKSSVHTRNNLRKSYECDYCSKLFFSANSFEKHTKRHRGIKDFKCHLCSHGKYSQKNSLKRHLSTIHNINLSEL